MRLPRSPWGAAVHPVCCHCVLAPIQSCVRMLDALLVLVRILSLMFVWLVLHCRDGADVVLIRQCRADRMNVGAEPGPVLSQGLLHSVGPRDILYLPLKCNVVITYEHICIFVRHVCKQLAEKSDNGTGTVDTFFLCVVPTCASRWHL